MTETLTIRSDSGVTLTVEPSNWLTDGLFVMLGGDSEHFPADDARKLAEWLAARFPTPATPVLKPGKVYRLLPGAKYTNGNPASVASTGATRVRLLDEPRSDDGNVWMRPLDGTDEGRARLVDPKYLAPLAELKVGGVVALLPGATPTSTVIDEAIDFAPPKSESLTAIPEVLNSTRVAAVEKALELLFTQADDVTVDDILGVAAYVADEIDIVHDDEADA